MAPFPELLRAAADGDLEQLKFLLASGVSPSVSNNIGQTGLHLAAMWGHDEACEALLAAKADVNVQNDWGVTPLHYAAQNSKYEVASLLLLNGAKPNLKAKNGTSPYESAKEDEMRDLCGGPKLEVHRAIKANDVKGVLKLVSEGADLSEVDNSERTALYLAVAAAVSESASVRERVGAMAMVGALLKAAQETSSAGQLAIAMCQRADDGMTPFHLAARKGSAKLMTSLLTMVPPADQEGMADVSDFMLNFKTHRTGELYNGSWGKKSGGELDELDADDMTMLHLAVERLEPDEDDDDDDEELQQAAAASDAATAAQRADVLALLTLLIEHKADVLATDNAGRAPIHQAVAHGMHQVATMLLDARADPTVGCKAFGTGNNTLHKASQCNDETMVRLLLASGTLDINSAGAGGWTPLGLAARSGYAQVAAALLEGGADPALVMANGKSALDVARVNKKAAIVKLLGGSSEAVGVS